MQIGTIRKSDRRSGGRANRIAIRSAPLPENERPIRPGMQGGQYKPLSNSDMEKINEAALEALEVIGLADAPPSGIDIMVNVGAILGDDGRLRFPRSLVEDMLAVAARDFTFFGRDPSHDLQLTGTNVHFGTGGAAVHVVDLKTREYRMSTLKDLNEASRLVHALDNIHFFQRTMVARDIVDNYELDTNTIYASCAGTTKHIGTSITELENVKGCLNLLHLIAGGEDKWRDRPFVSLACCFVVPPMKFATESCMVMESCIRGGMPVKLVSAGQAGATSPAYLTTAIVQAVAECLAGVVYVNAISPGHPALFGTTTFVSDLRSGAMSAGSGEQALLTAACAQMHQYYGLPGGGPAGMADSKLPDMQAGWEQAISDVMAGLSGLNMVYLCAGMHASLLGFCPESLILGNDLLGQVLRCVRGIEVTDENVSIETMRQVCLEGPGHYLGHEQTLSIMQSEYVYPSIADRFSPKVWEELGRPDTLERVTDQKNNILEESKVSLIDQEVDKTIRKEFKIHLNI